MSIQGRSGPVKVAECCLRFLAEELVDTLMRDVEKQSVQRQKQAKGEKGGTRGERGGSDELIEYAGEIPITSDSHVADMRKRISEIGIEDKFVESGGRRIRNRRVVEHNDGAPNSATEDSSAASAIAATELDGDLTVREAQSEEMVTELNSMGFVDGPECPEFKHLRIGSAAETVFKKINVIGFDIGFRLVERCLLDSSQLRGKRMIDVTEIMKFICKDFWSTAFLKNIDKLQTNHRGTYVLSDTNFQWLRCISAEDKDAAKEVAWKYLFLPAGMVRGALSNLGLVHCDVTFDILEVPSCTFTIKLN